MGLNGLHLLCLLLLSQGIQLAQGMYSMLYISQQICFQVISVLKRSRERKEYIIKRSGIWE